MTKSSALVISRGSAVFEGFNKQTFDDRSSQVLTPTSLIKLEDTTSHIQKITDEIISSTKPSSRVSLVLSRRSQRCRSSVKVSSQTRDQKCQSPILPERAQSASALSRQQQQVAQSQKLAAVYKSTIFNNTHVNYRSPGFVSLGGNSRIIGSRPLELYQRYQTQSPLATPTGTSQKFSSINTQNQPQRLSGYPLFFDSSPNFQTRQPPTAALESVMYTAFQKYEKDLQEQRRTSELRDEYMTKTLETEQLKQSTEKRAREIKRRELSKGLQELIVESQIRAKVEKKNLAENVATAFEQLAMGPSKANPDRKSKQKEQLGNYRNALLLQMQERTEREKQNKILADSNSIEYRNYLNEKQHEILFHGQTQVNKDNEVMRKVWQHQMEFKNSLNKRQKNT